MLLFGIAYGEFDGLKNINDRIRRRRRSNGRFKSISIPYNLNLLPGIPRCKLQ